MGERSDNLDPAAVDLEKVRPKHGLGSNFEQAVYPPLDFSTKARIWGDKAPEAIEPTDRTFDAQDLRRKRFGLLQRGREHVTRPDLGPARTLDVQHRGLQHAEH